MNTVHTLAPVVPTFCVAECGGTFLTCRYFQHVKNVLPHFVTHAEPLQGHGQLKAADGERPERTAERCGVRSHAERGNEGLQATALLAFILALTPFTTERTHAQEKPARAIKLHPAAVPVPALKYRLFPEHAI